MEKDFKKNINIKKTPFFFSFVVCLVLLFTIYSFPFTVSTVFSAGLQNYNVGSSGATNYEVGEAVWNGNIFQVQTRAGGTGTLRPLQIRTGTSVGFYMDTVGNVGIGTTQANNKLNVGGGIDLGTVDTSNLFRLNYDVTNGGTIQSYIGGAYAKMSLNPSGGNVGIGTTNPGAFKLNVAGDITNSVGYRIGYLTDTDAYKGYIVPYNNSTGFFEIFNSFSTGGIKMYTGGLTASEERLRITSNGNVGIATTTPSYKLDVVGGGQFSQPIIVGTPTIAGHAATKSYVDSMFTGSGQWTTSGTNIYTSLAGNVGIGTTTPSGRLNISGTYNASTVNANSLVIDPILMTSSVNGLTQAGALITPTFNTTGSNVANAYGVKISPTHTGIYTTTNAYGLYVDATTLTSGILTNSYAAVFNGGNVGIGTTAPVNKLQVAGGITLSGSCSGNVNGCGLAFDPAYPNDHGKIYVDTSNGTLLTLHNYYGTRIETSSGEILRVTQAGNVGIGVTNPQALLHVAGEMVINSGNWYTGRNAGGTNQPLIRSRGSGYQQSSYPGIQVGQTGDHVALFIDPVSVTGGSFNGNTNEIFLPNVVSFLQADSVGTNWLYTGTGTLVLNNGSVGIGVSPSYKLDVAGTGQFSQPVIVGTPTANSHATTKSYVDSAVSGGSIPLKKATSAAINFSTQSIIIADLGGYDDARRHAGIIKISVSNGPSGNSLGSAVYEILPEFNQGLQTGWILRALDATYYSAKQQLGHILKLYSAAYTNSESVYLVYEGNTLTPNENSYYVTVEWFGIQSDKNLMMEVVNKTTDPRVTGAGAARVVTATNRYDDRYVPASGGTFTGSINFPGSGIWNSSGNVGIGTTSPGAKVDVNGTIRNQTSINSFANGYNAAFSNLRIIDSSNPQFELWHDGNSVGQFSYLNGTLNYGRHTGGGVQTTYLTIQNGGNVGIGTTAPNASLHITTGTPTIQLGANANDYYRAGIVHSSGDLLLYSGGSSSIKFIDSATERMRIDTTGNVGIATTTPGYALTVSGYGWFNQPVTVGTPTAASHAATRGYVDSVIGGPTSSTSNYVLKTGDVMSGNLNMNGSSITAVNKLTVTTIDPLYQIQGAKYSTYASAIAGGVKEEYVGRGRLEQIASGKWQMAIDFNKIQKGSDLWVWYHAIEFSKDTVEVLATAYSVPVPIAYEIKDKKIIFTSEILNTKYSIPDTGLEFSYRLVGKRFDWREWPTYAKDQNEPAGLIVR